MSDLDHIKDMSLLDLSHIVNTTVREIASRTGVPVALKHQLTDAASELCGYAGKQRRPHVTVACPPRKD